MTTVNLIDYRAKMTGIAIAAPTPSYVIFAVALVAALFFVRPAHPQTIPYLADIEGEMSLEFSPVNGKTENGDLRLLGTFKLFNPDTVPFYIWVSFDNNGKLTKARSGRVSSAIRLMDMEFRYRDALHRPVVKKFPKEGEFGGRRPSARKRLGMGLMVGGNAGGFGRKKPPEKRAVEEADAADAGVASFLRHRGVGAVEIVFWKEDAQGYYEMELWGVLYAPDVKEAVVAGSYAENIKFEIEAAR